MVANRSDDAVPDPLPELRLGSPEFLAVTTENARSTFFLLFLLFRLHVLDFQWEDALNTLMTDDMSRRESAGVDAVPR